MTRHRRLPTIRPTYRAVPRAILVGIEHPASAGPALDSAFALAEAVGARVVVADLSDPTASSAATTLDRAVAASRERVGARLPWDEVRVGGGVEALADAAAGELADLIVISSVQQGTCRAATDHLAHEVARSTVPVLLVPGDGAAPADRTDAREP